MSTFKKEEIDQMICISGPMSLDQKAGAEFIDQAKSWLLSPIQYFVLDLSNTMTVDKGFYKAVIQFKSIVKSADKFLYTINANATLHRQFQEDGVEQVFSSFKTMAEVKAKLNASSAKPGLDVSFINPFLKGTIVTLDVQCKTKIKPLKPYLKKANIPNLALAGVLSLISHGYSGSIAICFTESVFLKIYQNMFDEKVEKISPEVQDAAGEILNIIYGQAKTELNKAGHEFQKALPTVLAGEKLQIRQTGNRPTMIIPFETEFGQFHMEIEFNNPNGGNNV